MKEQKSCRVPTQNEAYEILSRFIASHFNKHGKDMPRFTIPANADKDDDLLMSSFIKDYGRLTADLAATREKLRVARDVLESVRFKATHHDPAYKGVRTNGPMPRWDGVAEKIDDTLAQIKEVE